MSTKIEWAEETWNPISGCTKISPACDHCYAERMAHRLAGRCGYPTDEPFRVTLHPDRLSQPLRWRKPRRIFVVSMGDLFHEDVPDRYIAAVFGVMSACPQHTFMVLTKRPERMREWCMWVSGSPHHQAHDVIYDMMCDHFEESLWPDDTDERWPLPNVWLGVTAEDQRRADERIPVLLSIPAAVRFVSVEPMLGQIDATDYLNPSPGGRCSNAIDWVICGGETGPGARPMNHHWTRELRDQCSSSGIPFFFKSSGGKHPIRSLYGETWEQMPDGCGGD